MPAFTIVGERLLLTFWVGGMWMVGFVVAPTLFHLFPQDRMLAGNIAGQLFTLTSYIGLLCGVLLLFGAAVRAGTGWLRDTRVWTLAVMIAITLVGEFVLAPMMRALKAGGLPDGSAQLAHFMRLHGISSTLFVINSLLGLGLVAFGLRGDNR
jgi:hypothetical protein